MALSQQTIFLRTALGDDVRRHRAAELPKQFRLLLNLVDGQTTVEQIARALPNIGEIDLIIEALEASGLIFPLKDALHTLAAQARSESKVGIASAGDDVTGYPTGAGLRSLGPKVASAPILKLLNDTPAYQGGPAGDRNAETLLRAIKESMIVEIRLLLGDDARPAIEKILASASKEELSLTLIALKRVLSLYASASVSEQFVRKFPGLLR